MPYYETVFMARQDLSESQVKDLTDRFDSIDCFLLKNTELNFAN